MWGNKVVGLLGGMDIWGMIIHGDCLEVMATFEANSIDAIVTDPPYGLSFMGKNWDHGIPGVPFWAEALRVAKPGCHLLAFGGARTSHRLTCAIEDAGWEIRDCLMWVYGSG
jgi:site-specific DNA-methyltransferase (adenine-specific)